MAQRITGEQFLPGIVQRDESKLGDLYDLTAPALFGLISQIVSDSEVAQEILMEAFARLWRDAKKIEASGGDVVIWLIMEARSRAVDWHRAQNGLKPLAHARFQQLMKFPSWIPRPNEIAEIESRRHLLEKLAHRLPKPQSELLELAVLKGFTETEIARQHEQPPGRIEHELRAGLRFLRHRLRAVLGTWTADI